MRCTPFRNLVVLSACPLVFAACGEVTDADPDAADEQAGEDASGGGTSGPDAGGENGNGGDGGVAIEALDVADDPIHFDQGTSATCAASGPDGSDLVYTWQVDRGEVTPAGDEADWGNFTVEGSATITCKVDDAEGGGSDEASITVDVVVALDALVAHYPFDDGSLLDASGNGHHISGVSGDAEFVDDRHGNEESALEFEGATVTLPDDSAFDLTSGTIMARVHRNPGLKEHRAIISKSDDTALGQYTLRVRGDSVGDRETFPEYGHDTSDNDPFTVDADRELHDDNWYHLAAAFDASEAATFVNGSQRTVSSSPPAAEQIDAPVRLGSSGAGHAAFSTLDDVRIYDRPLTEAEIQAIRQGE